MLRRADTGTQGHLAIEVQEIPALSYAAVDVHVSKGRANGAARDPRAWLDGDAIENELVRVEVRGDGAVEIVDKRSGAHYQRVFAFEDVGDVGDDTTLRHLRMTVA